MNQQWANSSPRQTLLGVAAVLALFLASDSAWVAAGRVDTPPATAWIQRVQAGALSVVDGGVRFANDMRALYQLGRLQELTPRAQTAPASWPQAEERDWLFWCSETPSMQAPAKSTI